NRLIRCVCGKKIGPDPRNFNQRVSLGRNDLLIRTFPSSGASILASKNTSLPFSLLCITPPVNVKTKLARQNDMKCYLAHIL
ncbi:hypothetical protein VL239_028855, partial [Klebsiella pneumoniae]